MFKLLKYIVLSSVIILSGCYNLKVTKLNSDDLTSESTTGLVYPLQFTQYSIKLTRGIANCESLVKDGDPDKVTDLYHDVKPFIKAEISSDLVDDGDNFYVINSDSLNGLTNVTNLEVTWSEGKLTSINASADDRTGEIISSVASGVGKIAVASMTGGILAVANGDATTVACTPEANAALQNVNRQQGAIKNASTNIERLSKLAVELELDLKKIGKDSSLKCSDTSNKDKTQCKLEATLTSLKTQQAVLKEATSSLKISYAKVSYEKTITWPEDSKTDTSDSLIASDIYLKRWITTATKAHPDKANISPSQLDKAKFKDEYEAILMLKKIGSYGKTDLTVEQDFGDANDGIRYRVPANGYLIVCKYPKDKDKCDRNSKKLAVASLIGPVMQLGSIFSVPFESKAFTNSTFSLSFDESGRLTKAVIAQPEAAGENMALALEKVAQSYADIETAKNAKREAEKPKTELELLQEAIALEKAQKEYLDAQNALSPSKTPLIELQEKTALAKAQKDYLDAQNALLPVIDEQPSMSEEAIAVIQSETALLLAKVAKLEASLAIKKAEEALLE
jgi:hypothetical protein